jgi:serine/threonine-protein kinase
MDELPATFGKYYLAEKLATGGMAEIYLGKILGPGGFEKQLVIKQIHPRLSGQRQFVDMFVAEAKTLVTLAHGNIVPVYELGVVDDIYFIAMEYIDGPTLYRFTEAAARRGFHLPSAIGAWIAAEILEGLDYAHRKGEGVIHRDLSPRNVMLSRDGEVKLVDFGIAVALGASGDKDGSAPTGSFPYMSPEQVRREPLDGQSDLFSVGVLLWEMLTGQRLFARSNSDATLQAVLEADILLPSSIRPSVPARLDDAVARALARDRSARWPSAADFLAALNKHLYSLDKTPGARDLAPLVAKLCPPEVRRMPTESGGRDEPSAPFAMPTAEEPNSPPSTAVMARDGGTQKKVLTFAKQKSFATHVEWKQVLERATPLLGTPAITELEAAALAGVAEAGEVGALGEPEDEVSEPGAGPSTVVTPRRPAHEDLDDGDGDGDGERGADPQRRATVRRRFVIGAALVVAAAGGVTARLAWPTAGSGGADAQVLAMAPIDASPAPIVVDAAGAPEIVDASPEPPDARAAPRRIDAREAAIGDDVDARPGRPDAGTGPEPRPDARVRPTPDAAVASAGRGTLKISARPWGKVTVDGKPLDGTTPKELSLPAGKHTILVEFTATDPPQRETRVVEVRAGEVATESFHFE